jgi:hypothetical protein
MVFFTILRFKITGFLFFLLLILAQTEQIYSQSSANYTFSTNTAGSLILTTKRRLLIYLDNRILSRITTLQPMQPTFP